MQHNATLISLMTKPLHIYTRAQNHPDKQKSHKSRYMSRIGGCSPALAATTLTSNKHGEECGDNAGATVVNHHSG